MTTLKKNLSVKNKNNGRYLRGQVSDEFRKNDFVHFMAHRWRVQHARSAISTQAPPLNPHTLLNGKRMMEDAHQLRRIDLENRELLKKINVINRLGGSVDSYNPIAYMRINRWPSWNRDRKRLEQKNRALYALIRAPISAYDTRKMAHEWHKTVQKMRHICRFPMSIVKQSTLDVELRHPELSISRDMKCQRPELRKHVFLEFSTKNGDHVLGRVIVELYQDFVPVTVQNFLALCGARPDEDANNNVGGAGTGGVANDVIKGGYRGNRVHRIVIGQFMEMGDITVGTGRGGVSIFGANFHEENHKLKHTKPGVLSMKRVGGSEINNSQFLITFKKLEHLDRKNVVFGDVIVGNDLLLSTLQFYGRKVGKPLEEIVISNCGQIGEGVAIITT